MLSASRRTLTAVATVSMLAAGGAALAGAATNTNSSSSSSSGSERPQRAQDTALTGAAADKVKAAALEEVPGGTVLRSERGGPGNAAYHAHVRKSDGSEVVVLVNSSFDATSVQTRPAGRRGGPGHRGGSGGQAALTGDAAAKVKAAALEKVPGGTVLRTEQGGHGAAYHAHVRKPDGGEVVVLVNAQFEATSVEEFTRP